MEIISIDTNVLVRFLVRDDDEQYQRSVSLFNSTEIFIANTVILETEWVLRFAYGCNTDTISKAFYDLLGLPKLHVENITCLLLAIKWHTAGLDFADALHLASSQDMKTFATFDKAFVGKSKNLGRCRVINLSVD